ncbi:hypothetical protein GCM10022221_69040 [Actinocorallia aurea]
MNAPANPLDRALTFVCEELDNLRRLLRRGEDSGDPPVLRAVLDSVTSHPSPPHNHLEELLEALHQAIQASGDSLGVWGQVHDESRHLHLPGISGDIPFEPIYSCPMGRCAGRWPDQATAFPLVCAITGRPLDRGHL